MFGNTTVLREIMICIFWSSIAAIVVALIVNLFLRNHQESKDPTIQKPSNSGATNVLLYVGSFLIFGSMMLSVGSNPVAGPVLYIMTALLTYVAGLVLYQMVPYLRPVALAFTYTGLALFPFLVNVLTSIGVNFQSAFCASSLCSLFVFIGAAVFANSSIAGWLSYFALIFSGWSIANLFDNNVFFTYIFFIWPIIVSYIPVGLWLARVKWLPVPFRRATKALASILAPIATSAAAITFFIPDFAKDYPFLRAIIIALALGTALLSLSVRKSRGALVATRFYIQALLLAVVADSTNYSIVNLNSQRTSISLSIAIIWLISFLIQTVCSLFIPQRNEKEKNIEKAVLIISLIGIFITSILCLDFEQSARAIVNIVMAGIIAILGICISLRYKNFTWAIATAIALCYIPSEISNSLLPTELNAWVLFGIYTFLSFVFIGIFALAHKKQEKNSRNFIVVALIASNLCALYPLTRIGWGSATIGLAAIETALVAAIAKRYALLEISAYVAAAAFYVFVGDLYQSLGYTVGRGVITDGYILDKAFALEFLRSAVVGATVLGMAAWRERGAQKSIPRHIIGVVILSVASIETVFGATGIEKVILSIVAILIHAGLLVYGLLTHRKWIAITAASITTVTVLNLSGDSLYLWFAVIGAALIGIVIWQLTKNNKKPEPPEIKE